MDNDDMEYDAERNEEDENLTEDEGFDDYYEEGYHPVFVGEILVNRYVIL